jgi:hypothetical protein
MPDFTRIAVAAVPRVLAATSPSEVIKGNLINKSRSYEFNLLTDFASTRIFGLSINFYRPWKGPVPLYNARLYATDFKALTLIAKLCTIVIRLSLKLKVRIFASLCFSFNWSHVKVAAGIL